MIIVVCPRASNPKDINIHDIFAWHLWNKIVLQIRFPLFAALEINSLHNLTSAVMSLNKQYCPSSHTPHMTDDELFEMKSESELGCRNVLHATRVSASTQVKKSPIVDHQCR
jgi:hypothetical protein